MELSEVYDAFTTIKTPLVSSRRASVHDELKENIDRVMEKKDFWGFFKQLFAPKEVVFVVRSVEKDQHEQPVGDRRLVKEATKA
ncbi:hypothetical protein H257_12208 [Aphanomyces astaci]|uniref:Uncharacterized protein n=1 Tax=Aphanomyces astaci TaxID=112090 RepID=W4G1P2_APHAT|nr:hypothetical protein H257_12208 [Aphanomyces astaci]ETV72853.1 hypothetical protein H257_12208 [Aphanomyces astaci]|eukprot:XP_009837639.1 hypothetical protein H257_12208 [Aphanomyces astaci]